MSGRYSTALDCHDPNGERHSVPTYAWGRAPAHLFTRRQLRAACYSPGRPPVGQMLRPRKRRPTDPLRAWLYDVNQAVPKRVPTPAQLEAIRKANRAQRICGRCGEDAGYRIPRSAPLYGECLECAEQAGRITTNPHSTGPEGGQSPWRTGT